MEFVRQRNKMAIKLSIILVRMECLHQRNEVAIKLGIIFSSFFVYFFSLFLFRHLIKTP